MAQMPNETFRVSLRREMLLRGLSEYRAADLIGVTRQTLRNWIAGETEPIQYAGCDPRPAIIRTLQQGD